MQGGVIGGKIGEAGMRTGWQGCFCGVGHHQKSLSYISRQIMTPLMPTLRHHGMDCRVELWMGRLVSHSSEGGWQGCFWCWAPPKRPPYTSWLNHDPTCCTLVHHHRSMTRRSEESVATKRDCGKGTAPHNIWPTGAIRKHLLFSFLGGNTTSLREDWWHSRLKGWRPFSPV